ncbi:MAG: GDP-mannose 4,6-dehydratase, partial [Dehalococcoidia bacterium]
DTVEGFVRAAASPEANGQVINVGSGKEISIGALAKLILELVDRRHLPITCESARLRPEPSEVDRLCADHRKAQRLLNWQPQYTLEAGLTQTIEWIRQNLDRYRVGTYAV